MLLQKELAALLGLLSDDTRAIEAVGAMFVRTFAKADHFRVATALWCALPFPVRRVLQRDGGSWGGKAADGRVVFGGAWSKGPGNRRENWGPFGLEARARGLAAAVGVCSWPRGVSAPRQEDQCAYVRHVPSQPLARNGCSAACACVRAPVLHLLPPPALAELLAGTWILMYPWMR